MEDFLTGKERCLAALEGRTPDRVPVFPLLMLFSAVRAGHNYFEYASDGTAMAESQISTYKRFPIDAITSCSDAFRICADLGGGLVFPENTPPFLPEPLVKTSQDLAILERRSRPDPGRLGSRMNDRVHAKPSRASVRRTGVGTC